MAKRNQKFAKRKQKKKQKKSAKVPIFRHSGILCLNQKANDGLVSFSMGIRTQISTYNFSDDPEPKIEIVIDVDDATKAPGGERISLSMELDANDLSKFMLALISKSQQDNCPVTIWEPVYKFIRDWRRLNNRAFKNISPSS